MTDIQEHFIQEVEIGDVVFNTDNTNMYITNRSINNDKYKNKPDIETYIFNNNLETNFFYKENGIVLPIRHQPRLHLDVKNGNGVHIVKYYTLYQDSYTYITDIIKYNMLINKEKSEEILSKIKSILIDGNRPLNKSIRLRFITFISESTILLNKAINIEGIIILKDLNKQYIKNNKEREDLTYKPSLKIDIEYSTNNTDEQMYFKAGEQYIKIKSKRGRRDHLNIIAYADHEPMYSGGIPLGKNSRNIHGIYTKKEVEKDLENTHAQSHKLVEEYLDTAKKKLDFIDDIRKTILNDEQAKLEVQKAILKLTETINKSEITKSVKDYKELLKGDKADTTLVSDLLKIFKSMI